MLVCLAVWTALRAKDDMAKLAMIFWCLFAFIGAGFEHSVANMTLLGMSLRPPTSRPTWGGFVTIWCRSRWGTSWVGRS